MKEDFLALLQERYPKLSKGQRAIADYLTESFDKAAFMTANKLGRATGVSESTVVRFATELGYEGYPGMQKAMQESVMNRLTSVQRMEVANDRMGHTDPVTSVLQSDMDMLRQTCESVDREAFRAAVEKILGARRIYVVGSRSASAPASFLSYYLNYMFDDIHTVTGSGFSEMLERIAKIGREDVVIAFSFPRYSSSTIKCVQYCRGAGATVIGITNSKLSPLAEYCDLVLLAKSNMLSLVDSLVAPLSLVNALIVALATAREEALANTLDMLENIWQENNIYERRADQI